MGIEPTSIKSQVLNCSHLTSSVWAHLGAQFSAFREKYLSHFVDRITLGVADRVRINSQSNARIRVPHLIPRHRRIRSPVHEQTRVAMSECMHSTARDPQFVEHRPEPVLDDFVGGERTAVPVEK